MTPEEFESKTNEIISNLSDQAKVSETLTQLNETYKTAHTSSQTLQDKTKDYEKEIKALKDTNMNLFLKVNQPPEQKPDEQQGNKTEPLTYDKLLEGMGVKHGG